MLVNILIGSGLALLATAGIIRLLNSGFTFRNAHSPQGMRVKVIGGGSGNQAMTDLIRELEEQGVFSVVRGENEVHDSPVSGQNYEN